MTVKIETEKPLTEKDELYAQAAEQAEAGNYQQALDYLNRYLEDCPDDPEALNDIGAIMFSLGQTSEAIEHLTRAQKIGGNHAEILWNLSEAYLAAGQPEKAASFFDAMAQKEILDPDLLNRTANVFLLQEKLDPALELLEQSLTLAPEQDVLKPMIEVIRSKMTSSNAE